MILTHMQRLAANGDMKQRAFRLPLFITAMTVSGAAALQAKAILAGRDPMDMDDPRFWTAAGAQGGALGIYGDFVYGNLTRHGQGAETVLGPVNSELVSMAEFGFDAARKLLKAQGDTVNPGAQLARYVRTWVPGSNLWYSRAASDRLIFDQIQTLADPAYSKSFKRVEDYYKREFGSEFWWAPGDKAPERPPDIDAAFGR